MPHSAGCGVEGDTVIYRTDTRCRFLELRYRIAVIRLDAPKGVELGVTYHSRDENVGPHGDLTTGLYVS